MRAKGEIRLAAGAALGLLLASGSARAESPPAELPPRGTYLQLLSSVSWGKGLRFNNPYRLATPLGDSAESVSASAGYLNLATSASLGNPDGVTHGASLGLSVATDGVPQEVLTPAYQIGLRLPPHFLVYARGGLPIVLGPDPNVGYEAAVGGIYFFTAGIGATAEMIGSLFYGAATQDTAATAIPLLSLQAGLAVAYEVLP